MSHSFTNLLYHLVFSTKHRVPCLAAELRPDLFAVMGRIISDEGGIPLAINGVSDHVHLLVKLRQDRAVSDVLRALKAKSSGWMHRRHPGAEAFSWQNGYGAFTVSQSQAEVVARYVRNQERHHQEKTFADELSGLLRAHQIVFDEEEVLQ